MFIAANMIFKTVPKIPMTSNRSFPEDHCLNNAKIKFSDAQFDK
jgi:hypothetical protein